MPLTGSPEHDYQLFIEQAVEDYKVSIPRNALLAVGDEAVSRLFAVENFALTELALCEEVDRLILQRLELPSFETWRAEYEVRLVPSRPLVDIDGDQFDVSDRRASRILSLAQDVSDELILALSRTPELVHRLTPRKFEELIAELLYRRGAQVSLTPATRDGGRDILACIATPVGSFVCFVECKKYAPDRRVGVRPVRELYGVVSQERVTQGLLVTTSGFTSPALAFRERVPHQISLKAYSDVVNWLTDARTSITKRPG